MTPILKNLPWNRIFKFAVTGGLAFAIDFGIYLGLTRIGHLPYLLSRSISISLAMIWNFTLNRYWTFQAHTGQVSRQIARFTIVMVSTSLLSLALMRVGVTNLHLNDLLVLIVVSLLIMAVNFTAHQQWSYK